MSHRFELFIALSVAAHLAAGAAWLYQRQDPPPVVALADDPLSISIGLQAALAGAQVLPNSPQVEPNQPPDEMDHAEPEPEPEPEPEIEQAQPETVPNAVPILPPQPERKPPPKPKPEPAPKPPSPSKPKQPEPKPVANPKPQPEVKPKPKPEPKPEPKPKPQPPISAPAQPLGQQGINGSANNQVQQQETGAADAAGAQKAESDFDYRVRQHLLAKKRTPKIVSRRKQAGTVTVEFVLDRQGLVLQQRVVNSSEIKEFDRAGARLIKQAVPFPKAPDTVHWQQRTYTIDINYQTQ